MQLKDIFAKPIDRPIEGVIKADDDVHLRLEVEEYVLTKEVAKHLGYFLDAYNDYTVANGAWISGFFGSGKSHLLKMLALLLENKQFEDGASALDLFLPKCGEDALLKGSLQKAANTPSQSILFNIDQKADVISKTEIDALLAVFVKVFDEMFGYYGKQGHIAQFERDLDQRGQYTAFKEAYQQIAHIPWERGREQALLEGHNIAQAYTQVTDKPAEADILDRYRAQYKLSIEDFAEQINTYLETQGPTFRLNFFVDEVGQYIADNTKLMTNLQTIAESLATKCGGRAWLLVTAQEDMNTVMGEMGKQQSNDFSKIQARFKNRLKLTSANVDEVIQKRLLTKTESAAEQLAHLYEQQHNNFRTLFDFANGSQTYRNFQHEPHFVQSYPFVPYQFTLFRSAMENLSAHNAFEGKHSSVGERSMLGVFQQVVLKLQAEQKGIGDLATFDLMFEGIRSALKSQTQRMILNAEQHLNNRFAIRVLKALFLVKYIKEFKATQRNITVLMTPSFTVDLPELRERVETALNTLEQETYIQRNGALYSYLTNEEKDVEQEIKNTEVDSMAVAKELGNIIFDTLLRDRKIRHDVYQYDYAFSRKLDDQVMGRDYELTIHVVSPFHPNSGQEKTLVAQAMGRNELLVILPEDKRLVRDLMLYKSTEKYLRHNLAVAQQESRRRILGEKQVQNRERFSHLTALVGDLVGQAKLIVEGQTLDITSQEPKTRLVQGFLELTNRTYPNLRMLRGHHYTTDQLPDLLKPSVTLLGDDAASYSEAEQDMLSFINLNKNSGQRTTLQTLVNRFERQPYGWYLAAIVGILAKLCARGKVEVRLDGNILEGIALERALQNTHGFANVMLTPQIEFTARQIRQLRDFFAEFFDQPPTHNEAKALGQETAVSLQTLHQTLTTLRQQAPDYPFLTALDVPLQQIKAVSHEPYPFYLTELPQDDLLDAKEDIISPIRAFMNGTHKTLYDEARTFLRQQRANLIDLQGDEARTLKNLLDSPHIYRGQTMREVRTLLTQLQQQLQQQVQQARDTALADIDHRWAALTAETEFEQLTHPQKRQLQQQVEQARTRLQAEPLLAVIRDSLRRFETQTYPQLLNQMSQWAMPPAPPPSKGDTPKPTVVRERQQYVSIRNIQVRMDKAWLGNEADVEAYLAQLKAKLLEEIRAQKRIQL